MKQIRALSWEKDKKDIENHEHCGSRCYVLKEQREQKPYSAADNLPMYSKV